MKINNDCARKVLIEIEKIPYGETLTVAKLQETMLDFTIEEVLNVITSFNKERYLIVFDNASYNDSDVLRDHKIKCLTEKGTKVLDLIRDNEFWNSLKEKIDNFDELSIYTIFDIASKIMNVKYNILFDLPKDLLITYYRW